MQGNREQVCRDRMLHTLRDPHELHGWPLIDFARHAASSLFRSAPTGPLGRYIHRGFKLVKKKGDRTWMTYEEIAAFVLNQCAAEFGLSRVEGKQVVSGKSGTEWEVDARGWAEGDTAHFLVECKRHGGTAISQAITGSLAYQIRDTDAKGGFLVSPRGLQSGARKVAAANNIHEIKLDPKSTTAVYFGEWLGKLRAGFTDEAPIDVSEHLVIKEIDSDGNVAVIYDSEGDDKTTQ